MDAVPTLTILVADPLAWRPQVAGELIAPDGSELWCSIADSEEELLRDLTRREGRDVILAELYPHGFYVDWRWPSVARSA